MKRSVWLPLAILAVITASFALITALNQSGTNTPIVDGDWTLVSATDADGVVDLTPAVVTVSIGDGMISGRVCNSWGGNFSASGSAVTLGPIASTEMYCTEPAGIMELETRLLTDIATITTVESVDGDLRLTGADVELRLTPAN